MLQDIEDNVNSIIFTPPKSMLGTNRWHNLLASESEIFKYQKKIVTILNL